MQVFFTKTFLDDLQNEGDAHFPRRVLRKIFDHAGQFRADINDHRYHGIEDGWIRYVSQGKTAYRLIYVRRGTDVILYRAGPHSVEDRLPTSPVLTAAAAYVPAGGITAPTGAVGPSPHTAPAAVDRMLKNTQPKFLTHALLGRRLIPHKEIILVSPYVSPALLRRTARFGRVLDDLIDDQCKVLLVTRPPKSVEELSWLGDLAARGLEILFHPRLHAKIYVFCVDSNRFAYGKSYDDSIIIGSANLTAAGMPFEGDACNEELCYELPANEMDAIIDYITYLTTQAIDLTQARIDFSRRKGQRQQ